MSTLFFLICLLFSLSTSHLCLGVLSCSQPDIHVPGAESHFLVAVRSPCPMVTQGHHQSSHRVMGASVLDLVLGWPWVLPPTLSPSLPQATVQAEVSSVFASAFSQMWGRPSPAGCDPSSLMDHFPFKLQASRPRMQWACVCLQFCSVLFLVLGKIYLSFESGCASFGFSS